MVCFVFYAFLPVEFAAFVFVFHVQVWFVLASKNVFFSLVNCSFILIPLDVFRLVMLVSRFHALWDALLLYNLSRNANVEHVTRKIA